MNIKGNQGTGWTHGTLQGKNQQDSIKVEEDGRATEKNTVTPPYKPGAHTFGT